MSCVSSLTPLLDVYIDYTGSGNNDCSDRNNNTIPILEDGQTFSTETFPPSVVFQIVKF